jgi:hypothetical protein
MEAEITGNHGTDVIEILGNLIVDNGNSEGGLRRLRPDKNWMGGARGSRDCGFDKEISPGNLLHIAPFDTGRKQKV